MERKFEKAIVFFVDEEGAMNYEPIGNDPVAITALFTYAKNSAIAYEENIKDEIKRVFNGS